MFFIKTDKARDTIPPVNLYICVEDISTFFYNAQHTIIHMKNGNRWEFTGDLTSEIAKAITASCNGKVITL